jgi:nitroreductase
LLVQTFQLAACGMGGAAASQAAFASQPPFIREYFGLAEDRLVLLGISFGYPDEAHPADGYG